MVACVKRRGRSGNDRCLSGRRKAQGRVRCVHPGVPDARRPAAAADRQRRLRRPPLRDRPRLRPGGERLRLGDDDDRPRPRRRTSPSSASTSRRPADRRGERRRRRRQLHAGRRERAARRPAAEATQPMKLVVDPARRDPERGRLHGQGRATRASRRCSPTPTTSIEGWIPACYPLSPPQTCDGAFVVNEPIGRPELVPVEQLSDRQGDLRDADHGRRPRRPRSGSASSPRKTDNGDGTVDLALDRGRPDGHLPDDGDRRRLRLRRGLDDRDVDRPHAPGLQRDRHRAPRRRS